jgi:hypothetical protein
MRGFFAALLLAAATVSVAQEGFPLDGTWRSESTAKDGSHRTIVLIMQWDGKSVTGTINPGPKGTDFTGGQLNPDGWKFTLDVKDAKGGPVHFEGVISDLGKYKRVVTGKWTDAAGTIDAKFVHE